MSNPYRNHEVLRIDEESDYAERIVTPKELPEAIFCAGVRWWLKEDIDDWLDAQRGPGGDRRQEAS